MLLAGSEQPFSSPIPLVLDLDGTLIHTDTFHEMMAYLLIHKPLILLKLPFWFLKGRPYAKAQLVAHTDVNLKTLPYNKSLLSFARQAQQEGRPLILATGTDQRLAQKISDHLGIFQQVIGSDGKINMTGEQKSHALVRIFGEQGFDYAGDSPIDEFVWKVSHKAIVVCPKRGVLKKAHALKNSEHIHSISRERTRFLAFLFALRPLFWVFNLIAVLCSPKTVMLNLFQHLKEIPKQVRDDSAVVAILSVEKSAVSSSFSLFIGLSFLASGLLILGDLLTLEKERRGGCNIKSVFAEGHLHLLTAFIMAPLLIFSSLLFLFLSREMAFYSLAYIPLFMSLDRLTRHFSQSFRWALLGFFQLLTITVLSQ